MHLGPQHVYTLNLTETSVRGDGFEVLRQDDDGEYRSIDGGPVRTYIGHVAEDPSVYACGYLDSNDGRNARVIFDHGETWG